MGKWKKGDPSPNPSGRPKLPDDLKELKRLNQMEIEKLFNEYLQLTPTQLKKKKEDPESTALELLIFSVITQGINKGDQMRLDYMISRLIGKMKENVKVEVRPFQNMTDAELAAEIAIESSKNPL